MSFSAEAIAAFLMLLAAVVGTIIGALRYFEGRRKADADKDKEMQRDIRDEIISGQHATQSKIEKVTQDMDKRVDRLEQMGFLPGHSIEQMINHEKANRGTAHSQLQSMISLNTAEIVTIKIELGKLEERYTNMAKSVDEIKGLIKESKKESKEQFDEIKRYMSETARKIT